MELAAELWREFRGAIADCEEFVASERAVLLRRAVDWLATGTRWAAWAWAAGLALYLLVTPINERPIASAAALDPRSALFMVFGIVLVGPVVILLIGFATRFVHRVVSDLVARRVPRAFALLASPGTAILGVAILWAYRQPLLTEFRALTHEIATVFEVARQFTLTV